MRQRYLRRFGRAGCEKVDPVPVIAGGRGTLFTNSVLLQFLPELLGEAQARADAIASHQICLRLSGKSSFYGAEDQRAAIDEGKRTILFEQLGLVRFRGLNEDSIRKTFESLLDFIFAECGVHPQRVSVTVHEDDQDLATLFAGSACAPGRMIRVAKAHRSSFAAPRMLGRAVHFVVDRLGQVPGVHADCEPTCRCGRWVDIGDLIVFHDSTGTFCALDSAFSLERLMLVGDRLAAFETEVGETPSIAAYLAARGAGRLFDARLQLLAAAEQVRTLGLLLGEGLVPGGRGGAFVARRLLRDTLTRFALGGIDLQLFNDAVALALECMRDRDPYCTTDSAVVAGRLRAEQDAFAACVTRAQPILNRVYDFQSRAPRVSAAEWEILSGTHALTPAVVALVSRGMTGAHLRPR